jgi:Holliday junction resolvase RusA-like endonuclease
MSVPHTDNAPGWARGGLVVHLPLLHLSVPGDPVSQGNPQRFPNGGMKYPKATANHRAYVESMLATHWAGQPPITDPVIVRAEFHFARPAAHYGTGRNRGRLKDSAPTWHAQQPDLDKLFRLILDSLTHAAVWADDKLAGRLTGEKHWTETGLGPRTEITIYRRNPMELSEGAHALELKCPECGRTVQFPIELSGRLTVDSLNGGKLKPVMSSKSLEHTCNGAGQGQLEFADEGDE